MDAGWQQNTESEETKEKEAKRIQRRPTEPPWSLVHFDADVWGKTKQFLLGCQKRTAQLQQDQHTVSSLYHPFDALSVIFIDLEVGSHSCDTSESMMPLRAGHCPAQHRNKDGHCPINPKLENVWKGEEVWSFIASYDIASCWKYCSKLERSYISFRRCCSRPLWTRMKVAVRKWLGCPSAILRMFTNWQNWIIMNNIYHFNLMYDCYYPILPCWFHHQITSRPESSHTV